MLQTVTDNPGLTRRKAGRPRKEDLLAIAHDETQAFDKAKTKWSYLSLMLADEAIRCAKSDQKGLTQITTAAAIAYDKAFSKREADAVTISIPATLAHSIRLGLELVNKPTTPSVAETTHPSNCDEGGMACAGLARGEAGASSDGVSPTQNSSEIEKTNENNE